MIDEPRAATLSPNERIKTASQGLRGTLTHGLTQTHTGAIAEDDQQLVKFHGMYLQDDRDLRPERTSKKLDKAYTFMLRLRIPGGVISPAQWLKLDAIARDYAGDAIRLTTRQTVQYHGVIKHNLKATMRAIDAAALDTLGGVRGREQERARLHQPACLAAHAAAYELATRISVDLLPVTGAYREIWLDGEPLVGEPEVEPIYGQTYLPRKFKAVVAVPPDNDVDVFAHDLGFIAIVGADGALEGWNVTVGGGMGMTHGEPDTYPRTADSLGFVTPGDALKVAEAVVTTQRDWGNRTSRKHARLKYTIDTHGLDAFRDEVARRAGVALRTTARLHLQGQSGPLWLGRWRGRPPAPYRLRRGGPPARHPRGPAVARGAARDRHHARWRVPRHRQPESHHRQRRAGRARTSGRHPRTPRHHSRTRARCAARRWRAWRSQLAASRSRKPSGICLR